MLRTERLPFVALAMLSLIVGLLAGLHRIGWNISASVVSPSHGAIMVGGFIGTLITIEKIIPLKRKSLFILPLISGGSIIFFSLAMPLYAWACLLMASIGLSIVYLFYLLREHSLIYTIMFAGAVCWLIGNIFLVKTNFYPMSIPWWMAFVLLTITAERLELMKFLPVSQRQKFIFIGLLINFVIGCMLSFHGAGSYLAALAVSGSSLWLMRHDVVGLNLKKNGLTRYVGVALLSGYFALLLSGIFLPFLTAIPMGYDILVHSFFIGFVISMIFAHGPIILPGVLGVSQKPFHPILYFWLFGLHASWMMRVMADVGLDMHLRKISGLLSAIAMVGYFLSIAIILIRSRAKPF